MSTSRKAFEEFHAARKAKGLAHRERLFNRLADGTYFDEAVQRHWWTWQNACSARDAEITALRARCEAAEADARRLREALRPFANYACEPPCDCHNCRARAAIDAASSKPAPSLHSPPEGVDSGLAHTTGESPV